MKSAAQVGLLLVLFIGLVLGSYTLLGHSLFAPKTDRYYADLEDAGGIAEGTPVLMAGVNVGTVRSIRLVTPRRARLAMDLKHGTFVPAGSEVVISESLIGLGQNPVTIAPPERFSTASEPVGGTLEGRRSGPLDSLLPNSKATIDELKNTMASVRKLLQDPKLHDRVEGLMASTQQTMDKFGKLAAQATSVLSENRASIDRAIAAATGAIQDVQRITMRVTELVRDPRFHDRLDGVLARVQSIEQHTDELVGNLNKLVNDPSLRQPARDIAKNVADITSTGKSIANHADVVAKNGEVMSANGIEITKNVAIVTKKAITLTDQANQIEANAIELEGRLNKTLDKVGGFFDHAPSTKGFHLGSEVDLMRESDPGIWRTDITFDTSIPDGTLYAGIYDAFETNKITVQIGHPFAGNAQYRYGIYASKPGFGVDYPLVKRLSIRADAWDINNPRLDLRAKYDFGNGLTGWFGVDHVFHENAPTIGIGIVR